MNRIKKDREKPLQEFSNLLKSSYKEYLEYSKEVNEMDKATQDVLHQLELGEKISISKWSKELVNVRKKRRYAKDMVMLLEPLYDYYVANTKSINQLENIVGEIRKIKNSQSKRVYRSKVLSVEFNKGEN